jgi:hypothetical protein
MGSPWGGGGADVREYDRTIVPDSQSVLRKQQVALRSDRCSSSNLDGVSVHEECGERVVEPLPIRGRRTELTFLAKFGKQ